MIISLTIIQCKLGTEKDSQLIYYQGCREVSAARVKRSSILAILAVECPVPEVLRLSVVARNHHTCMPLPADVNIIAE